MTQPKGKAASRGAIAAQSMTLATLQTALERSRALSATRLRDLRSAVRRIADLLGNEPAGIALDMEAISMRLGAVNPLAIGMTAKRFANIRSDFQAAVKVCGVTPVITGKKTLSPAWVELFERLSGRRAHIGLSRLGRYASAHGIKPGEINDEVMTGFIASVRQGSLHRHPNKLHRQTTLIWNEAARDPKLGLQPVTVASFRGPPNSVLNGRRCRLHSGKTLTRTCLGAPAPIHSRPTLVHGLWHLTLCGCARIKSTRQSRPWLNAARSARAFVRSLIW